MTAPVFPWSAADTSPCHESSVHPFTPLDASAADALREVVLPPLPADFPRGSETVHGRFIATGDIRTMRRTLEFLRRAGYF